MQLRQETWIGLMVVIGLCLTFWGYKFLKGQNMLTSNQIYFVQYDYVDRLEGGDPVVFNGYQVGSVTNIKLDGENYSSLVVELNIKGEINIHKNTVAYIYSESIMGEKAIQLEMPGLCRGDQCAESGDFLQGKVKGMIQSMVGKNEMDLFFDRLESNITSMVDSLGQGEDSLSVRESMGDLQVTLDNLASFSGNLDTFMRNSSAELEATVNNLYAISENIEKNNEKISKTFANAAAITEQIKNAGLDETVGNINTSVEKLNRTMTKVEETIQPLKTTLDRIEQGQGTLGKLTTEDELYIKMQRSMKNLEYLLQDIRLNPKRYIHISVFGKDDKEYTPPENDPAYQKDQ